MRRILLILSLVLVSAVFAQHTITQAEYFVDSDPGEGLATAISVPAPASIVSLAWTIPTTGLPSVLQRVMLRVRTDAGLWSRPTSQFLLITPIYHDPLLVTQFEWAVDNGSYSLVDVADASIVSFEQLLSTVTLAPGILHKVNLRVSDNIGRTGPAQIGFLAIAPTHQAPRLVTQYEYAIDNGTPTAVDVTDGANVNLAQVIETAALTPGSIHRIMFRVTDDLGRVSSFTNTLLPIQPISDIVHNIVSYEYWIDSNSPTLVDNPDAPFVNISELIASNSLNIGLHHVNFRTTDELGRTGEEHRVPFLVMSPYQPSDPRTLVAAEVFVGNDPGIGNGVNIPLPVDGVWDEGDEPFAHVYTGFDVGYYRIGYRTQDNLGRWSGVEYDSLLVGPLLTVLPSGNDIILNWEFPDGLTNITFIVLSILPGHLV